jgi:hypothetical protein
MGPPVGAQFFSLREKNFPRAPRGRTFPRRLGKFRPLGAPGTIFNFQFSKIGRSRRKNFAVAKYFSPGPAQFWKMKIKNPFSPPEPANFLKFLKIFLKIFKNKNKKCRKRHFLFLFLKIFKNIFKNFLSAPGARGLCLAPLGCRTQKIKKFSRSQARSKIFLSFFVLLDGRPPITFYFYFFF